MYWIMLIVPALLCAAIFSYMYFKGAYYVNRLKNYSDSVKFKGIEVFRFKLPEKLKADLLNLCHPPSYKRVDIAPWKAGCTIPTSIINENIPNFWSWYSSFSEHISGLVGVAVRETPLKLPTSCAILIYEQEGDFINWHYDVNYFKGRFFTVLIPLTQEITDTKFIYRNVKNEDVPVDLVDDVCVVFEGENLFHMASKLAKNQRRIILSLQYATDSDSSWWKKWLSKIKDRAYV